jgi:glycosyltransferase involved in cell wall biosynthesis
VASQLFVVDSFSTDRTVAIAESLGARVWQHEFMNHAAQLAWALENLPIDTEWVMRVDGDEIITPFLAKAMQARLQAVPANVTGVLVSLYVSFQGALIRHGGYPQWQLRIWRNGKGMVEQRWMDEKIVVNGGLIEKLHGEYIDDNLNGITWWTNKHNGYATREAIDLLNRKYEFMPIPGGKSVDTHRDSASKRWIKENIYSRLPFGLRAFLFFIYRIVFRLGFLDGRSGFVFHFLQGFWYRFLVDVKVSEVQRRMQKDGISCIEAIRREFGVDPVCATASHDQPTR